MNHITADEITSVATKMIDESYKTGRTDAFNEVLDVVNKEVALQKSMNDYRASGMDSSPPDALGTVNKVRTAILELIGEHAE